MAVKPEKAVVGAVFYQRVRHRMSNTSATHMARRLLAHVKTEMGGGWEVLTPRLQEGLVMAQASLSILGWRRDLPVSEAQDLLRAVHALFEEV